ncbi:DUF885 domain-containing protein [Hyalangium rubrum]|uniref:DUF885 domain-containing protein n=1 Tax=Hyalangium rubrum TaxID=3103134 RepID=A0ABU5HIQ1_9BACT|nr:DUF885 domain-containing protein [Hyalangium sp. s54d21]MDY7233330.1 DUF885 domain-containing protein [Hyalangium sp. s54d21]
MRMLLFLGITALVSAGCRSSSSSVAAEASAASADERLTRLVEEHFEETLVLSPVRATMIGDNRYNDRFTNNLSDEHRARRRALYERSLEAARKLDPAALSPEQRLTHTLFVEDVEEELDEERFPQHLLPINQFYSTPNFFVQLGSGKGVHPFKTVKDYEDFLARVDGFLAWNESAIARLREGIEKGIVLPRVLVERTLPQLAAHVVDKPEDSLFFQPVKNFPEGMAEADRARLTETWRATIRDRLVPAYRRLHDFLRDEYLPRARPTVGLSALPGGSEWYAYLVRKTTTTDLTPDALHALGLREVARIHGEMDAVIQQLSFKGDRKAFEAHLEKLPELRFKSREDMLQRYRETKARVDALTPRLFDLIPKQDYEVRAVEAFREKSAAGGSYMSASPDGSRPGVFYLNTRGYADAPFIGMEALTLHEGAPGHHFQISIQQTLERLPRFRRFGGYTAYAEGWGLYAETLGAELGMYQDPYQRYGALSSELWRAIRLVLDTGLHAKGWTREQAIAWALENSPSDEPRVTAEVERFIAIPSQALAYKVGQLKISELRARAEKTLGPAFDIKAFHRQVLEDGALPLKVLESKVDRWLVARQAEQKGAQ